VDCPRNDTDHIRRNTTLRLFAGISVITGAENPSDAPGSHGVLCDLIKLLINSVCSYFIVSLDVMHIL
jgi:hypothetical protein